ncbi:MAG: hypothetical protein CL607_28830 [Anaerolineaceae bacterium]|jgi:hypothetical protein|nr:hypothetical protein [Anaerolineaceae bacterium]MAU13857.1 hypothetical protein [Anaerolineaceae bacterium]|tara:strand:+ start:359 stop:763 length:405 start_codon:yes stop_codon:yes gene_type:complete
MSRLKNGYPDVSDGKELRSDDWIAHSKQELRYKLGEIVSTELVPMLRDLIDYGAIKLVQQLGVVADDNIIARGIAREHVIQSLAEFMTLQDLDRGDVVRFDMITEQSIRQFHLYETMQPEATDAEQEAPEPDKT